MGTISKQRGGMQDMNGRLGKASTTFLRWKEFQQQRFDFTTHLQYQCLCTAVGLERWQADRCVSKQMFEADTKNKMAGEVYNSQTIKKSIN